MPVCCPGLPLTNAPPARAAAALEHTRVHAQDPHGTALPSHGDTLASHRIAYSHCMEDTHTVAHTL